MAQTPGRHPEGGRRQVEYHHGYAMNQTNNTDGGHTFPHDLQQNTSRMQIQEQTLRAAEASKQMVYDVFGNVIADLEEWERRELGRNSKTQMQRSNINTPSQFHKKDKDITTILETQLLILQVQLKSCNKEIKEKIKEELTKSTYKWMAHREAQGIPPNQRTDQYAGQILEILCTGKTVHPEDFTKESDSLPGFNEENIQRFIDGQHQTSELDKEFRKDPNKKATFPDIRGNRKSLGLKRFRQVRPDLDKQMPKYSAESDEDEDMSDLT